MAVSLAVVHFLFQTEPFEEEYREHHPVPTGTVSLSSPSLNWEMFDKTNAPPAFTFDPEIAATPLGVVARVDRLLRPDHPAVHPVRDKSPPSSAL